MNILFLVAIKFSNILDYTTFFSLIIAIFLGIWQISKLWKKNKQQDGQLKELKSIKDEFTSLNIKFNDLNIKKDHELEIQIRNEKANLKKHLDSIKPVFESSGGHGNGYSFTHKLKNEGFDAYMMKPILFESDILKIQYSFAEGARIKLNEQITISLTAKGDNDFMSLDLDIPLAFLDKEKNQYRQIIKVFKKSGKKCFPPELISDNEEANEG